MVRHARLGAPKLKERELAIELRRRGLTYSEILKQVPVAKSTLSVWLGDVRLTRKQVQRISNKKHAAQLRGAAVRKEKRVQSSRQLFSSARTRVGKLSPRERWLVGVALYWGEGSKQKNHAPSTGVIFSNSDPTMLRFFLAWLHAERVPANKIDFELYLHASRKHETQQFLDFWCSALGIHRTRIRRVYYKKGTMRTKRRNTTDLYKGLLRITVRASTDLNRSIMGAAQAIGQSVTMGSGVIGNTSAFGAEDSRFET